MPSYCIHVSHGLETMRLFHDYLIYNFSRKDVKLIRKEYPLAVEAIIDGVDNEWRKEFMAGLILPDAAKQSSKTNADELDRKCHYPRSKNSYFKTPDMSLFLKEHRLSLDDPLYLGYAMHLYLDIQFDDYICGKYTFIPANNTEPGCFEYMDSIDENNFSAGKEKKRINANDFWGIVYEDYTKLNPYYMDKYKLKIESFASPDRICPVNVSEIIWYDELYRVIREVLKKAGDEKDKIDENISAIKLIDVYSINMLIHKSACDFLKYYLIPLVLVYEKSKKCLETKSGNSKWKAENTKIQYYKYKWLEIIKKTKLSNSDKAFFQGVIDEILDVTESAAEHRDKHCKITFFECYMPIIITVFSAVVTALQQFESESRALTWVVFSFGIASTLISASLAAINQYSERKAHKESWLRQRLYYSVLMSETEQFCEKINEYEPLTNYNAVKRYMQRIEMLRKKDYENFFTNMGCSNFES